MATRETLLAFLEANRGTPFSGEELAGRLNVSRTAVWKAVNTLRAEGYPIDAAPNRGYCLAADADVLSAQGIRKYLNPAWAEMGLEVLPEVDSTNQWLRQRAGELPEGFAVLAQGQTGGRGRNGRSFYSPAGTGVYLSLLLRPGGASVRQQSTRITTLAAVAACEAMEALAPVQAGIKWVNDVYVAGKKVCGILTEGALSLESGQLDYAVLGIGINAYAPAGGFPPELADIAAPVFTAPCADGQNHLAAEFLNRFLAGYAAPDDGERIRRYRARSLVIGREVEVLSPGGARLARALDVDSDCRLVVQYPGGEVEALSAGEIRVKLHKEER